ncbi:MAG: hypothetical protein H0X02_08625 [Nitrosomonas sp.]|nr:hypothetical protein [Nitrosomonas sp.]
MKFQPGNKLSPGRTKGSASKLTLKLMEKCDESGFDPVKEFLANYLDLESPKDKCDVILKFMEYLYPKRTRLEGEVEVNDVSETPRVQLTQENIIQFIQAARDKPK